MNKYNTSEEVWKDVKGYEGYYQVSNLGRVKSLDRHIVYKNGKKPVLHKGRILKKFDCGHGYLKVSFNMSGKYKAAYVHKVVADTFLPSSPEGFQVNHKDGNKTNNNLSNLEFISAGDNIRHAHASGLVKKYGKKLTEKEVIKIRKRYAKESIDRKELTEEYGISKTSLSCILRNKTWRKLPHYSTFK